MLPNLRSLVPSSVSDVGSKKDDKSDSSSSDVAYRVPKSGRDAAVDQVQDRRSRRYQTAVSNLNGGA